ncbi:MAG: hypothetical protein ABIO92_04915 [Chloroflexia bacterium]
MLASQGEIKNKIEQLRLGFDGYSRQLTRPNLDAGRRERLEIDVHLLGEEIATLEKLLQLGRAVDDRTRIEEIARERLEEVRRALAEDDTLSNLNEQERDYVSGEISALVWALGEDALTLGMAEMMRGRGQADPTRTDRALPAILIHQLEEAPDAETRASAAYELGKLHITQAIPNLKRALKDKPIVAQVASSSLAMFTIEELEQPGTSET